MIEDHIFELCEICHKEIFIDDEFGYLNPKENEYWNYEGLASLYDYHLLCHKQCAIKFYKSKII